ncbi:unnamed protein product [Chilo suppressalis]|uniref:Protein stum n=1 Tax=Chilo suppressalis TaxID=168631 RepID=A0ABN8L9P5_CHISP|nr:unnamed protein product [Chilo suppressalis]
MRLNNLDVTIQSRGLDASPSKDLEDDRFFNRSYDDLFGPQLDSAFTVTQLIHAQDRYFDLSSRQGSLDSPAVNSLSLEVSARKEQPRDGAFKVLSKDAAVKPAQAQPSPPASLPVVSTAKKKKESSFAILAETPAASRPTSPRSLPVEIRSDRRSPFKGRGFREETSRHNTPRTSAANSRASSPPRRRTHSLSKIDKMAQAAALPMPIHNLSRPHSPRNFVKENIEEVRELSELNREKHEAEAERKRKEEEEALLKEMGLLDKNAKSDAIRSVVGSRTTSRSNSPTKTKSNNYRSRSNSPAAILHYQNIPAGSKEFINVDDEVKKPVTHKSRVRAVSKSVPQSNEGSPKHSKIPKRQNSVSPVRIGNRRENSISRRPVENGLKNQRFMSNSTSSIHETIRVGSQVHDKRNMSKSTQFLDISPTLIKGKPPISPGKGGPPPSNKAINSKRLSPIVGTPNKSPIEDLKPSSAKRPTNPSPAARKPVKTAGNTPATSRLNSRQPSRTVSRDSSPEKRKTIAKPSLSSKTTKPTTTPNKPVSRTPSTKVPPKTVNINKTEQKPPINRTNSMKSLPRTPSTKNLYEKPPLVKKSSKKDLTEKAKSTSKINEVGAKKNITKEERQPQKSGKDKTKEQKEDKSKIESKASVDSGTDTEEVIKQDNQTQYDKITNEKGELVILTKKNIVSMTTAAITSQPLEVVTTVTNQLPAALEKAREKGMFERLSSKESLIPKDEDKDKDTTPEPDSPDTVKSEAKKTIEVKADVEEIKKPEEEEKKPPKVEDKKPASRPKEISSIFIEDNIKLRPLQPPYNNPQVERVKQKIDEVLKSPEVSTENILAPAVKAEKEMKSTFKNIANKTKTDVKESKDQAAKKLSELKDQMVKQNEKLEAEMRHEAAKIVDSIITPVEEPKKLEEKLKEEAKKEVESIVLLVKEKTNGPAVITEKITETLVKGEPDLEVQSSNVSTPGDKIKTLMKVAEANDSDKSAHSNGGFPQSTSTTPKPPARTRKQSKDEKPMEASPPAQTDEQDEQKKPNICSRLMGKCRQCCPCCGKAEDDERMVEEGKARSWNCFKKKQTEVASQVERAAGKAATIEYENETHRKRTMRELLCGCCKRQRRVSDASALATRDVTPMAAAAPGAVNETSCCGGRKAVQRRDSILSDRPPGGCCSRMSTWARGVCRRRAEPASSRRTSVFSKNKSMSPTLPPEDTRKKLDSSLVEHTSLMKGAIPVLPIVLAYFCLLCNIVFPGLGTVLSGLFCVCFGIPRFGVHDGAKHRIGSLVINLVVGCGQLFTVLFCLVGWGWSVWWGVIMLRISRKYRKLKAEEAAAEAEAAPPVTANNHTRA